MKHIAQKKTCQLPLSAAFEAQCCNLPSGPIQTLSNCLPLGGQIAEVRRICNKFMIPADFRRSMITCCTRETNEINVERQARAKCLKAGSKTKSVWTLVSTLKYMYFKVKSTKVKIPIHTGTEKRQLLWKVPYHQQAKQGEINENKFLDRHSILENINFVM